jgi:hypothetical protein
LRTDQNSPFTTDHGPRITRVESSSQRRNETIPMSLRIAWIAWYSLTDLTAAAKTAITIQIEPDSEKSTTSVPKAAMTGPAVSGISDM